MAQARVPPYLFTDVALRSALPPCTLVSIVPACARVILLVSTSLHPNHRVLTKKEYDVVFGKANMISPGVFVDMDGFKIEKTMRSRRGDQTFHWEVGHFIDRVDGGKDEMDNYFPLNVQSNKIDSLDKGHLLTKVGGCRGVREQLQMYVVMILGCKVAVVSRSHSEQKDREKMVIKRLRRPLWYTLEPVVEREKLPVGALDHHFLVVNDSSILSLITLKLAIFGG